MRPLTHLDPPGRDEPGQPSVRPLTTWTDVVTILLVLGLAQQGIAAALWIAASGRAGRDLATHATASAAVTAVATVALLAGWARRARRNAALLSPGRVRPSLLWLLAPAGVLVLLYRAVAELWRSSHPAIIGQHPTATLDAPPARRWAAAQITALLLLAAAVWALATGGHAGPILLIASAAAAAAAAAQISTLLLVRQVTAMQADYWPPCRPSAWVPPLVSVAVITTGLAASRTAPTPAPTPAPDTVLDTVLGPVAHAAATVTGSATSAPPLALLLPAALLLTGPAVTLGLWRPNRWTWSTVMGWCTLWAFLACGLLHDRPGIAALVATAHTVLLWPAYRERPL